MGVGEFGGSPASRPDSQITSLFVSLDYSDKRLGLERSTAHILCADNLLHFLKIPDMVLIIPPIIMAAMPNSKFRTKRSRPAIQT